jgi:FkbM family methyltransferase
LAAQTLRLSLRNINSFSLNLLATNQLLRAKKMFVTYAQNFEDVVLWRAFKTIEKGFYIDIGANDPVVESVSHAFYKVGWRGINVEPVPRLIALLKEARPDEVNLHACVGSGKEDVDFFQLDSEGMSSGDAETIALHKKLGREGKTVKVKNISLASLLEQAGENEVHWLKIDAEGMEEEIVKSWAPSEKRPWVLVVESTVPGTKTPNHQGFDPLLVEMGYEFVYFDGINRFYVHETHEELKSFFTYPPCIFDQFTLAETNYGFGKALIEKNREYLRVLNARNNEITTLMSTVNALKEIAKNLTTNIDLLSNTITQRQRLKK